MNKIFCLIGPSGTGKDSIADCIKLPKVICYTTREPRQGEIDGITRKFITKSQFEEMDTNGQFIAKTVYDGNYYGITNEDLTALNDAPMTYIVDWKGVLTLRENIGKVPGLTEGHIVPIFICTPAAQLEQRMILQGRHPDDIKRRIGQAWDVDYRVMSLCKYVVYNYDQAFNRTLAEVLNIILKETFEKE